jgi:ATP-binding protein involved in chromosome partitioning
MSTCDPKSCSSCNSKDSQSKDVVLQCKLARIKHKLIVMSGKGGVGKSSVAVYLALALAQKGHRVGLMDVDLHGPSVPKMLGLHGVLGVTKEEEILPHTYNPNLKVVSIGSLMEDDDSAVIWRGPLKHSVIQQFITQCKWDDLDFLVIDCPPGTGDEPLSLVKLIPEARAIIVTTPQEVALADVRKSINFCRKVNLEIVGLVENMSGLYCPHCQGFIPIFRQGGGQKTSERMNIKLLGALPFDPAVVEGGDLGRPTLEDKQDSPFLTALQQLLEAILERLRAMAEEAIHGERVVH